MRKSHLKNSKLFTLTALLCATSAAHADAIYQVAVNTSSISGTNGSIDFQFNAGNGETQAATVTLSGLSGGTLGSETNTGAVTGGPLPAAVTIGTGTAYNDVFETFKYGSTLTFTLDFTGPAVNSPNGLSTGNSEFFFSTFSDANGYVPVLTTDPNGVAATVTVNPSGSITTAAVSPQATFVPEPGSLALMGGALALLVVARKRLFSRVS